MMKSVILLLKKELKECQKQYALDSNFVKRWSTVGGKTEKLERMLIKDLRHIDSLQKAIKILMERNAICL
jgi:cytochrome oxidase Cu insertion factor (SCO1/SenC/PrrC family)